MMMLPTTLFLHLPLFPLFPLFPHHRRGATEAGYWSWGPAWARLPWPRRRAEGTSLRRIRRAAAWHSSCQTRP